MVLKIIIALALFLIPSPPTSGAKTVGAKKDYSRQQKIHRGEVKQKIYTTCRLYKRIKSRTTGQQACIYRGGNKTYELMFEKNCPKQFKCVYNPGQPEPNIDSVIDSLNQIKK
jgi:hypothetical protein